jgi:crotonobetainyl-CoA:carnitine CoA-transferase CaiB-like acyl-CoA transferase
MRQAMDRRLVVGVVQTPEDVAHCPHLAERGTFAPLEHPEVGALRYPGPGFLINGVNPIVDGRAAPRLGEHNSAVYCGELGLVPEALAALSAAGVV